jgi:hypothetical protein
MLDGFQRHKQRQAAAQWPEDTNRRADSKAATMLAGGGGVRASRLTSTRDLVGLGVRPSTQDCQSM